ncbi:MAG TPA: hypothetical protein VHL31_07650, partial [Geminicoccus sp.]
MSATKRWVAPLLLVLAAIWGTPATEAGTPNAIPAGYLHTSGDRILDTQNRNVRILGVNWFGLETNTMS